MLGAVEAALADTFDAVASVALGDDVGGSLAGLTFFRAISRLGEFAAAGRWFVSALTAAALVVADAAGGGGGVSDLDLRAGGPFLAAGGMNWPISAFSYVDRGHQLGHELGSYWAAHVSNIAYSVVHK